jgi:hypothetical protein
MPEQTSAKRWRTQEHTIPAQVGGRVECFGLGVYPGPIAYLSFPSWADDGATPPHIGLLPGQVDALINALEDARALFRDA